MKKNNNIQMPNHPFKTAQDVKRYVRDILLQVQQEETLKKIIDITSKIDYAVIYHLDDDEALARLYEWFSSIVLIFFLVVRFALHDNDTLYTIVYILVVAEGVIGLLTFKKRNPDWRILDITFNVILLLLGGLALGATYNE